MKFNTVAQVHAGKYSLQSVAVEKRDICFSPNTSCHLQSILGQRWALVCQFIYHILYKEACTCLRLKVGSTAGSGHGPQWGTWALMSGRMNAKTSTKDNFMVETGLFLPAKVYQYKLITVNGSLQINNIKSTVCVDKATNNRSLT